MSGGLDGAERVAGDGARHLARAVIEIEQERSRHREVVVGVVDADPHLVRLAVAEHPRERGEIDAIGEEIQRLDARDRTPEQRIDGAGEQPRVDRRDAGRLAVDRHLRLAERGPRATEENARHVVRHAGEPELVARLALRDDVEIGRLDVGRQREGRRQHARRRGQQGRAPRSVWKRQDGVGGPRRGRRGGGGVEEHAGAAVDDPRVGGIDQVPEVHVAGLRGAEQRAVVGEIALHVPRRADARGRLHGGAEVDVHVPEGDLRRAVELAPRGDREVRLQDHLRPRRRAARGGRVGERLRREVGERQVGVELHDAGRGARTRHRRIGGRGVRGTDLLRHAGRREENAREQRLPPGEP